VSILGGEFSFEEERSMGDMVKGQSNLVECPKEKAI
jgi:hypothetical protein